MRAVRAPGQESAMVLTFEPFFFLAGFLLAIINRFDAALVRRTWGLVARFVSLRLNS